MAILLADRVQETSTSPGGTGALTLTGSPVPGYKSFSSGVGTGNSLYYTIYDAVTYQWEVGIGSWSANVLTRTSVLSNSLNTTAFISFTNGNTLNVWVDYPASTAVAQTDVGTAPNQIPVNGMLGKLAFMDVLDTVTNNPYNDTAISDVQPSLLLDFANSKTLDPRITYTRASTATYYDGKTTAVAEQNLLTYSQDFTQSAWSKNNGTATANSTTAPDGTSTASLFVPNTTSAASHGLSQFSLSLAANFTFSFYVKANGYTTVYATSSGSYNYVYFDLSSGTVQSTNGTGWTSSSIVSAGNGWYRCVVTGSLFATSVSIGVYNTTQANGNTAPSAWSGDGTSGIYLWGAQLEQRSAVSSYTPTTSSPITNYIPALQTAAAGVPRFDHDPVTGESKGFLIEEQRTNLLLRSQEFDNAAWTKTNATVTANTVVAPDGTLSGDLIYASTSGTFRGAYQVPSVSSAVYTASFYVKNAGFRWVGVVSVLTGSSGVAWFDLTNGVVGTVVSGNTATITNIGNGWYRCSITFPSATSFIQVFMSDSDNSASATASGTKGIYIWGAQLEAGSFATSYIPTTSAQVTRSADAASMTGTNFSSWYSLGEGTFYSEWQTGKWKSGNGGDVGPFNVNAGGNGLVNQFWFNGAVSASYVSNLVTGIESNQFVKVANSFESAANRFAGSANGNAVVSSISTVNLSSANTLTFGSYYSASDLKRLNNCIRKIAYYPKRLSDAELQEMTL